MGFGGEAVVVAMGLTKKYLLYLLRWQLSTIILAPCVKYLSPRLGVILSTVAANLIGGLLFFWYDMHIVFHSKLKSR
jgi:hypothetical protein